MACNHSNVPPESTLIREDGACVAHNDPCCRECSIEDAGDRNAWDWEKDQRRGYCPQPGCGVFLPDIPAEQWPNWYAAKRCPHTMMAARDGLPVRVGSVIVCAACGYEMGVVHTAGEGDWIAIERPAGGAPSR